MKNLKPIALCLLIASILTITLSSNLLAQSRNGVNTFTLDKTNQLTFEVPDTFTIEIEDDNDVDFTSVRAPEKLVAILIDSVFVDGNPDSQEEFIEAHKNIMKKSYPEGTQEGVDEILGFNVPYIILPEPNSDVSSKVLYMPNNNKVFLMTITFNSDAPFEDVEVLIERVLDAVDREDDQ